MAQLHRSVGERGCVGFRSCARLSEQRQRAECRRGDEDETSQRGEVMRGGIHGAAGGSGGGWCACLLRNDPRAHSTAGEVSVVASVSVAETRCPLVSHDSRLTLRACVACGGPASPDVHGAAADALRSAPGVGGSRSTASCAVALHRSDRPVWSPAGAPHIGLQPLHTPTGTDVRRLYTEGRGGGGGRSLRAAPVA